jgi:protein transport protein YIF1
MAFVTYILLSAFTSGVQGHFSPEDFSVTASYAFAVVLFEFVAIKLGCYLLNIGGQGQVLDLVAYGGYKFVGIVVTMLVRLAGILGRREDNKSRWGRWFEWGVFIYCFLCLGFFMVCALRKLNLITVTIVEICNSVRWRTGRRCQCWYV